MDAPELKPCPFCGDSVTTIEGKGMTWRGTGGYSDPNYYELSHHGKFLEIDDFPRCSIQFRARSADDCADFWNRRADMRPRVKPLVWERGVVDWARPLPGMKYVACSTTPAGSWGWWLDGAPETREVHPSEEAAKAAAQADYERRILAALEE